MLGVYALESNWVNLLGHGGAVAALACGIGTSVTAVAGIYGVSKRRKCILLLVSCTLLAARATLTPLQYFLVVLTALVVYLVVGATALFSNESFDTRFSKLWCDKQVRAAEVCIAACVSERDAHVEQAQTMFNCCGYNCPFDRPAQGNLRFDNYDSNAKFIVGFCAGKLLPNATLAPGVVAPPLSRCSDSNPVVVECQNIAIAAGFPQGCKSKALNFINQRFVPLFVLALVFGLFLILAFSLSFRLLCRSDPQNHAALSDKDSFVFAAQLNQWNPSSGSVRAEA